MAPKKTEMSDDEFMGGISPKEMSDDEFLGGAATNKSSGNAEESLWERLKNPNWKGLITPIPGRSRSEIGEGVNIPAVVRGAAQSIPIAGSYIDKSKAQEENPGSSALGYGMGTAAQIALGGAAGKVASELPVVGPAIKSVGKFLELGGKPLEQGADIVDKLRRAKEYLTWSSKLGGINAAQAFASRPNGEDENGNPLEDNLSNRLDKAKTAFGYGMAMPLGVSAGINTYKAGKEFGNKMLDKTDELRVKLLKLPPTALKQLMASKKLPDIGKELRPYTESEGLFDIPTAGKVYERASQKADEAIDAMDDELLALSKRPGADKFLHGKETLSKVKAGIRNNSAGLSAGTNPDAVGGPMSRIEDEMDQGFLYNAHDVETGGLKNLETVPGDDAAYNAKTMYTGRKFKSGTPEEKKFPLITGKPRGAAPFIKRSSDIDFVKENPKEKMVQFHDWYNGDSDITPQRFMEIADEELGKVAPTPGNRLGNDPRAQDIQDAVRARVEKEVIPDPKRLETLTYPGKMQPRQFETIESVPRSNYYGGENQIGEGQLIPETEKYFSPEEALKTARQGEAITKYVPGTNYSENDVIKNILQKEKNRAFRNEIYKGVDRLEGNALPTPDISNPITFNDPELNKIMGIGFPKAPTPIKDPYIPPPPSKFKQASSDFNRAQTIAELSAGQAAKDLNMPTFGNLATAITAQGAHRLSSGSPAAIGQVAIGVGLEAKRHFGTGVAIKMRDSISNILMNDPMKLGKYAGPLANAMRQSPAAFNAILFTYMNRPEFRKQIGFEEESFLYNDKVMTPEEKQKSFKEGMRGTTE